MTLARIIACALFLYGCQRPGTVGSDCRETVVTVGFDSSGSREANCWGSQHPVVLSTNWGGVVVLCTCGDAGRR